MKKIIFIVIMIPMFFYGQIKVKSIEKLNLPYEEEWSYPVFSPDGKKIYLTNYSYNGIWEYDLQNHSLRQITSEPGSGYDFDFSPDGKKILYRTTTHNSKTHERIQEIFSIDLKTLIKTKHASGDDIYNPTFVRSSVIYSEGFETKNRQKITTSNDTRLIGIENTKIVLLVNGKRRVLDPFVNGSYFWPQLSPDKTRIVAKAVDKGAFVCDLEGNVISRLGKVNAPVWTRDGKWIIYMDDRDDGHFILSSDIMAITPDGKTKIQLTSTPNIIEMYPATSPTENKIACSSLTGEIYIITYEMENRDEKME